MSFKFHRTISDTTVLNQAPEPTQHQQLPQSRTHNKTDSDSTLHLKINGVDNLDTPPPSTPCSAQEGKKNNGRRGGGDDEGGGAGSGHPAPSNHHPNGWSHYDPPNTMLHNSNSKPPLSRGHSGNHIPQGHLEVGVGLPHNPREQQENVVLRRGFIPRTAPERVAQRKSSMAQLQQWVNQRRGMASQEDINR